MPHTYSVVLHASGVNHRMGNSLFEGLQRRGTDHWLKLAVGADAPTAKGQTYATPWTITSVTLILNNILAL